MNPKTSTSSRTRVRRLLTMWRVLASFNACSIQRFVNLSLGCLYLWQCSRMASTKANTKRSGHWPPINQGFQQPHAAPQDSGVLIHILGRVLGRLLREKTVIEFAVSHAPIPLVEMGSPVRLGTGPRKSRCTGRDSAHCKCAECRRNCLAVRFIFPLPIFHFPCKEVCA